MEGDERTLELLKHDLSLAGSVCRRGRGVVAAEAVKGVLWLLLLADAVLRVEEAAGRPRRARPAEMAALDEALGKMDRRGLLRARLSPAARCSPLCRLTSRSLTTLLAETQLAFVQREELVDRFMFELIGTISGYS